LLKSIQRALNDVLGSFVSKLDVLLWQFRFHYWVWDAFTTEFTTKVCFCSNRRENTCWRLQGKHRQLRFL